MNKTEFSVNVCAMSDIFLSDKKIENIDELIIEKVLKSGKKEVFTINKSDLKNSLFNIFENDVSNCSEININYKKGEEIYNLNGINIF